MIKIQYFVLKQVLYQKIGIFRIAKYRTEEENEKREAKEYF